MTSKFKRVHRISVSCRKSEPLEIWKGVNRYGPGDEPFYAKTLSALKVRIEVCNEDITEFDFEKVKVYG